MVVSPSSVLGVMTLARGNFGWGHIREISKVYGIRSGQEYSY